MKAFKEKLKQNQNSLDKKYFEKENCDNEEFQRCKSFFDELAFHLKRNYISVHSCNKDNSYYLVEIGTENQISYYGKPDKSFRVSDHWNWYSSVKRCTKLDEVQCWSIDIESPIARNFDGPNKSTRPRKICQVAYYTKEDGKYHVIYGNMWNPKTRRYKWIEADPKKVIAELLL
jgi:hypothetical protein